MTKEITVSGRERLSLARTGSGTTIAPQSFADVVEFAKDMSRAGAAIPKHLRDNPGACMAVAMQAFEWNMSPFAVANKSYVVSDRVAYEAQLIAAVVNTRSGITGRLKYKFEGEGAALRCTVTGVIDGEELVYTSPRFDQITTKNSPMWKYDSQQQLGYYSARAWARRHVPEVILGVYDREEMEIAAASDPIDITPPSPSTVEAPPARDVVDVEPEGDDVPPPPPTDEERDYGPYASLGEYLEGLNEALTRCEDDADIETIWSEFDPLAMLEGDDDSQEIAKQMKARHLVRVETKP